MVELGKHVTVDDVDRMTGKLYLTVGEDRGRKMSAFWVLLALAAIIASAGVVADSTATVIGAMIVAPLMIPILGTALALVLVDRRRMLQNVGLVLAGALAVVAVGYLVGLLNATEVLAATNSQVAGRVSPKLIDLMAALATGVVGAFALVRSDVSDTLPGVAIAISLVPPLAVVGLTLESGAVIEALGALLLSTTNVAAIVATGTIVLLLYRIRRVVLQAGRPVPDFSKRTVVAVVATVGIVAIPLAAGTIWSTLTHQVVVQAQPVVEEWAEEGDLTVTRVAFEQGALIVEAIGSRPESDPSRLRTALDEAGFAGVDATVTLVSGESQELPASR